MPVHLEYDEESEGDDGLFGSDDEEQGHDETDDILPDTRRPVVVPASAIMAASASLSRHVEPKDKHPAPPTPDERYQELHRHRAFLSPAVETGIPSLKGMTMRVILQNASRIDDIGGLTYKEMAVFLDQLPRAQLVEIEENCPHILTDTDWLWEGFLIKEFPLFYPKCREKGGEARTSGWRRKFSEAFQEAEERKAKAAERIRMKYAEAEKDRQDKKIRLIDNFVATPKGRRGGHTLRDARIGKQSQPTRYIAQKQIRTASVMNRARADMQRQRVALTHASGKYVPPPSRPVARSSTSSYDNPYASSTTNSVPESHPRHPNYIPADKLVHGPRLPPRVPKPLSKPGSPPDVDRFPGSRRTEPEARSTLPDHIKPTPTPKPERFRIDDYKTSKTPSTRDIRRPQVQNFNPDTASKGKGKVDFFARPQAAGQSKRPMSVDEEPLPNVKRPCTDTSDEASASRPPPPYHNPPAPGDTPSFLLKKKTNRHSGPQRTTTTTLEAVKRSIAHPSNRVPGRRR
ncbi:hypothetical protein CspeluHIS016_0801900 [Cutaneotrichosporon spelunceum]|uniref:Elongin-A n=1 Tax=Cutaneotrichosporon spelunceum TaxID=1672016 RepID=A0AAD3TZT9_9TREE|nr:hypothetical protein CspeluHIS016_0801900 [Cutaneotrichosporon spelunceum]